MSIARVHNVDWFGGPENRRGEVEVGGAVQLSNDCKTQVCSLNLTFAEKEISVFSLL